MDTTQEYSELNNYTSRNLDSGLNRFNTSESDNTLDNNFFENNSYEMGYLTQEQDSELQKYLNLTPMPNLDFSSIQNLKNSPVLNSVNKSLKHMMSTPYHNNNFETSIQTNIPTPVHQKKFNSTQPAPVEYIINQNLKTPPIPTNNNNNNNNKTYSNNNSYKSNDSYHNDSYYNNDSYGLSTVPSAYQDTIPYDQFTSNRGTINTTPNQINSNSSPSYNQYSNNSGYASPAIAYQNNSAPYVQYTNNSGGGGGNINQPNSNPPPVGYQNYVQYSNKNFNNSESKKYTNNNNKNNNVYSNMNKNNYQNFRTNIPCQPKQQQQQHIPCQPKPQYIPCQQPYQQQQQRQHCNNAYKPKQPYIHNVGMPFVINETCYNTNQFNKLGPKAFPFFTPSFFKNNLNLKTNPFTNYFGLNQNFSNMNIFGNFAFMNSFKNNNFGLAGRLNNMKCYGFNGLNNFMKPCFNNNIFAF